MDWLPNSSQISRRQMIQWFGGGLGALGLASALGPSLSSPALASVPGPNFKPRAKRIIQLFMNGGPFGPDFFDPKPSLEKYAGLGLSPPRPWPDALAAYLAERQQKTARP